MADEEDLRLAVLDAIRTTWRSMGISNHSVSTLLEDVSFAVEVKAEAALALIYDNTDEVSNRGDVQSR
jgi:hypothetical protein